MRRWRNGGVRGSRLTSNSNRITSAFQPRGRNNGGIIGERRIDSNLDNNVAKTSGIWNIDGLVLVDHDVTTTTVVDNSYWEYPAPYQAFNETSRSYLGGGYQWNPHNKTACPGAMWPNGDYGGHSSSGYNGGLSRSWTFIGDQSNCSNWIFDVYGSSGYYYTVYPDPIYHEDITYVDTTTTYSVWNYF